MTRARFYLFSAAIGLLTPLAAAAPDLSTDGLLRDHLWREVQSASPNRRPKTGLILSAGSLRGTAHVGVVKVLDQAGFPIDVVAGTSMGAVIGSLYAGGLDPDSIWNTAAKLHLGSGNNLDARHLVSLLFFDRLLSSENTENIIRTLLHGRRFDELRKQFACVSMDIYTGETVVFRDGEVAPAVRASMNIPGVFQPLEYRHRYLVDGGVIDYIPTDAARLLGAEWTIASVTESDYTAARPKTVLDALEQVIDIRGSFLFREQRRQVDFLIEPPVGDIGVFDDQRITEAMEKGMIAAAKSLSAAKESLILASLPKLIGAWPPAVKTR